MKMNKFHINEVSSIWEGEFQAQGDFIHPGRDFEAPTLVDAIVEAIKDSGRWETTVEEPSILDLYRPGADKPGALDTREIHKYFRGALVEDKDTGILYFVEESGDFYETEQNRYGYFFRKKDN